MSYKVEEDFIYDGNRCVVLGLRRGHRCGYVGINKDNILYGKDYSDEIPELKFSDINEEPIGKRGIIPLMLMEDDSEGTRPDCYFDVHGGITYSGGGADSKYPVKSDLWWFGFDCAHAGDRDDVSLMDEANLKIHMGYPNLDYGEVRTTEYCINECKNLSRQLSRFMRGN